MRRRVLESGQTLRPQELHVGVELGQDSGFGDGGQNGQSMVRQFTESVGPSTVAGGQVASIRL
jgi:hypothetical protein